MIIGGHSFLLRRLRLARSSLSLIDLAALLALAGLLRLVSVSGQQGCPIGFLLLDGSLLFPCPMLTLLIFDLLLKRLGYTTNHFICLIFIVLLDQSCLLGGPSFGLSLLFLLALSFFLFLVELFTAESAHAAPLFLGLTADGVLALIFLLFAFLLSSQDQQLALALFLFFRLTSPLLFLFGLALFSFFLFFFLTSLAILFFLLSLLALFVFLYYDGRADTTLLLSATFLLLFIVAVFLRLLRFLAALLLALVK